MITKIGAAILAVLLVLAVVFFSFAWSTWLVMLLLGVVHHSIAESVPALGFWETLPLGILITLITGIFGRSGS